MLFNEGLSAGCKYLLKQGNWDPGWERGRGQKSHDATERPRAATSAADNSLLQQRGHLLKSDTPLREMKSLCLWLFVLRKQRRRSKALRTRSNTVLKAHRCRTFALNDCFQKLSNRHGASGKQLGCALSTGTRQIRGEKTCVWWFNQILRLQYFSKDTSSSKGPK